MNDTPQYSIHIPVELKLINPRNGFEPPTYATPGAAALDLVANIDAPIHLVPGDAPVLVPTGIAIYLRNPNYAALILPRSGRGHKEGVILGNGTGLIDSDYQGELFVSAWARPNGDKPAPIIEPGERFAQLMVVPVMRLACTVVEEFTPSARGEGGFGSTGKR